MDKVNMKKVGVGTLAFGAVTFAFLNPFTSPRQQSIDMKVALEADKLKPKMEQVYEYENPLAKLKEYVNAVGPQNVFGGGPGPEYNSAIPSDSVLLKWMGQTVEQTLAGMNVTSVNDSNYQREVYGSNRPVMVLFYNNRSEGSAGNATLVRVLAKRFPHVKICAYKISDGSETETNLLNHLRRTYGLKRTPAILFFKYQGRVINAGEDFNLHGGLKGIKRVKSDIGYYFTHLPKIL